MLLLKQLYRHYLRTKLDDTQSSSLVEVVSVVSVVSVASTGLVNVINVYWIGDSVGFGPGVRWPFTVR